MNRLKKWWVLLGADGIGPIKLRAKIERMGSLDQTWMHEKMKNGAFVSMQHARLKELELTVSPSDTWALSWEDAAYPDPWRELPDAPVVIFGRGSQHVCNARPFLAIVGTRDCTQRAAELSFEVGRFAASQRWGVVSGLAKGVDAMAHRGACYGDGVTVACLGSSLHRIYPREHCSLAEQIIKRGGTLFSEHAHGTVVHPWHFAARNRLIVGLSKALVMIQSPQRGGALISAQLAIESGVDCWVYRPDEAREKGKRWAGNRHLLKEFPSMGWSTVDELFSLLGKPLTPSVSSSMEAGLEAEFLPIWRHIVQKGGAQISDIAYACGTDATGTLRKLFILELKGMVQRIPGGWYIPRGLG